jgi:hypothetical protein
MAYQVSFEWAPSAFVLLREENVCIVRLTTYLNHVQRLRMSGSVPQVSPCAFMAYTATIYFTVH